MQRPITLHLSPQERTALMSMAIQDVRPPNDQLRYLLVSEAKRRGLLTDPPRNEMEERAQVVETGGAFPLHP